MPTKFEVKLRVVGNTFVITLPKPAVRGLDWKEDDALLLTVNDHIVVKKAHDRNSNSSEPERRHHTP